MNYFVSFVDNSHIWVLRLILNLKWLKQFTNNI